MGATGQLPNVLIMEVSLFSSVLINRFHCSYRARKNGWCALQGLIIGTLISQYALYSALLCSLHSSISKEQHEKYPCNPSSYNRKYGECACETHAPKINYWKTHKPVRFVLSYVLSVIQQRTAWKESLQSIQPLWKIRRIYSWNAHPISRYVKAITPQFQPCQSRFIT